MIFVLYIHWSRNQSVSSSSSIYGLEKVDGYRETTLYIVLLLHTESALPRPENILTYVAS